MTVTDRSQTMHAAGIEPARSHQRDQAAGLRRLFGLRRQRFVALVHNAAAAQGGLVIERLTAAWGERGAHTLVVDAAPEAGAPHEMALIDLKVCIERLAPTVSFLAARGLPMKFVDARGSTATFLDALADVAPEANVILVHAAATDLARLFGRRTLRPLLVADAALDSVPEAYAGMKVLAQRLGLMAYDLVVAADPASGYPARVAERLAGCADRFLGAALHDWVALDPVEDAQAPVDEALMQLALGLLAADDAAALPPRIGLPHAPASDWTVLGPNP